MKRILVVEDCFDFADNLQELFSFRGMEAVVAASGEAALEIVARGELFDVMLTDLRLPGMSGVHLITQLRRQGFTAPVLLMTAYLTEDAGASAGDVGVLAVLFKPLDLQRLVQLLDQCTNAGTLPCA